MGMISSIYGSTALSMRELYQEAPKRVRPMPAPIAGRVWLRVDYHDRLQVKSKGARWDPQAKHWYAPDDGNLRKFRKWIRKA